MNFVNGVRTHRQEIGHPAAVNGASFLSIGKRRVERFATIAVACN
ncbi:MAG: hypothetical protein WAK56_17830 [Candidatus Sulfotelmatobacter sp.]